MTTFPCTLCVLYTHTLLSSSLVVISILITAHLVCLVLFSALNRRVGALQISIIIVMSTTRSANQGE